MKDLKQKVRDLNSSLSSIKENLDTDSIKTKIKDLEAQSTDPNFWDDQQKARKLMRELGDLQKLINEIDDLESNLSILLELEQKDELSSDFKKEIFSLEKTLKQLELTTFLSGKYDKHPALVSVHAGQGGTEAMDWTSILFRMYMHFCERRGWNFQVIDQSPGEEAGLKSVSFKVQGSYAYGYLKHEAGTHRLVRQSPFNADQLRQTSFALVEVLPELEEVDVPDIEIGDTDLDWQFFRASSQGGQNVQKVSTAVRLKHKPTGITVTAQAERFQQQNRKIALDLLRAKLWAKAQAEAKQTEEKLKGKYTPASWGNQIRSYVLHPYKMVKDLRTQVETSDTSSVLDGNIDKFIEAEIRQL